MDLGVFLDFPHRKGTSEAVAFTESLRYARLVEALGLDSVWLGEHLEETPTGLVIKGSRPRRQALVS